MLPKQEFLNTEHPIPAPPWPTRRVAPPPISLHDACEATRDRAALHARYELLAGEPADQAPPADTLPDDDDRNEALIDCYCEGAYWGLLIGGVSGAIFATVVLLLLGAVASALPLHL